MPQNFEMPVRPGQKLLTREKVKARATHSVSSHGDCDGHHSKTGYLSPLHFRVHLNLAGDSDRRLPTQSRRLFMTYLTQRHHNMIIIIAKT